MNKDEDMKTAIFEHGKDSLAEWIEKNRDCEKMILKGCIYYGDSYEDELLYGFENIAKDFRPDEFDISEMLLLDYDRNISDELFSDAIEAQPSLVFKMLANRKYGISFVYNDGLITTPDKKVLVHCDTIAETTQVPEGIETIGRLAFAGIGIRYLKYGEELPELKVILPNGITKIDEWAFANTNLIEINFPDSLKYLGDCAFWGTELKEVLLPDGIEEIPECCFTYTWIEKLRLPSDLKAIRASAFVGLYLDEIRLPQSVEIVESDSLCGTYKKIYIPESIKKLADDFYYEDGIEDDHEEHKPIIIEY